MHWRHPFSVLPLVMVLAAGLGARSATGQSDTARLLTASDAVEFERPEPTRRVFYGDAPEQFGELFLPTGDGPHPVAVLIHGGCWLAEYDIAHIRKLSAALAAEGVAVWSLEYRRVGNPGGGWPGTFEDVASGGDTLRRLADEYALDLERVIAIGHSAGGHLALWLGSRTTGEGPLAAENPLRLQGIVALAPAADLAFLHAKGVCDNAVERLMGGSPSDVPERYRAGSMAERVPIGIPQRLVIGTHDESWAPVGRRYYDAASSAGDPVEVIEAPESGHFEMIDPDSSTWPLVLTAAREMLK